MKNFHLMLPVAIFPLRRKCLMVAASYGIRWYKFCIRANPWS